MYLTENLQEKWQPVLEHPDLPKIEDSYKRAVTTVILENQEKAVREDASFMAAGSLLHVVGSRFMTDMGGLRKKMRKT